MKDLYEEFLGLSKEERESFLERVKAALAHDEPDMDSFRESLTGLSLLDLKSDTVEVPVKLRLDWRDVGDGDYRVFSCPDMKALESAVLKEEKKYLNRVALVLEKVHMSAVGHKVPRGLVTKELLGILYGEEDCEV